MLANSLLYILFAYALAFALALMTAGIIKVIHLATSPRASKPANATASPELAKSEAK